MRVQEAPLLPSPPQADGFAVALRVALSKYIREHALAINALVDGGGSGVTDHGALTGLTDDDHPQYHNDARGDARYSVLAHSHSGLAPTAGTTGQVLKKVSNTDYDYSWQADATGSGSLSTASIPFTNGDTVQRVTVTDGAVTAASKVLASIRRADQADASEDRGYIFMPNIVRIGSGAFDVQVVCLDHSGSDPTEIPPNETVTLTYSVA